MVDVDDDDDDDEDDEDEDEDDEDDGVDNDNDDDEDDANDDGTHAPMPKSGTPGAESAVGVMAVVTLWYSSNSTILPSDEPSQILFECASAASAVPWCST